MQASPRLVLLALALSAALLAVATASSDTTIRGHPAARAHGHVAGASVRSPKRRAAPVKSGRKLLSEQAVQAVQKTAAVQTADSAQHEGDDHGYGGYNSGYGGYNQGYGNNGGVGSAVGGLIGGLTSGLINGLVGGGNYPPNGYPPNSGYTSHDDHGGHYGEHAGEVYYPPSYVPHGDHVDYVPGHYERSSPYGPIYGGKRKLMAEQSADAAKASKATETADEAQQWGMPHYDYHPPAYLPHGDHYDYVPGHYHYHDGPHWDNWGSNWGGNWGSNWGGWNSWAGRRL